MKHEKRLMAILVVGMLGVLFLFSSSCSFNFPYEEYEAKANIHVSFQVEPDDTEVLLNGRFVGLGYEFASGETALVLASKSNDLVLRKRGYDEQAVNLWDYPGAEISVQRKMKPGKDFAKKPLAENEEPPAPEARSETVQTPRPEKATEKASLTITAVTLTVMPPESAIYLDGKFWGISPEDGKISNLRLAPGKYRLEVVKPGFKSSSREMVVPKAETFAFQVSLES